MLIHTFLKSGWRWLTVVILLTGVLFNLTASVSADDRAEITLENEPFQLTDPAPESYGDFGWFVGISGDTIAVMKNVGVTDHVLIYQKDQGGSDQWGLVKEFEVTDRTDPALDGDTLFIGNEIYYRDEGGANNWGLVHTFPFTNIRSAALSGSTLAVGGIGFAEEVKIYYQDQGGADQWGAVATLSAPQPSSGFALSIHSVTLSGDLLLVGAANAEVGGVACGEAYIYARDEGGTDQWGQVATLNAPECQLNLGFGVSAALEGQTAVVGVSQYDKPGMPHSGIVYVFEKNQGGAGNWGLAQAVEPAQPLEGLAFGNLVSLSNGMLVVSDEPQGVLTGKDASMYIFQKTGGIWQQENEILPPPDALRWTINDLDASSEAIIVGMPFAHPMDISRQGLTFIFRGAPTDLDLAKTVSADEVTPGGALTYTLTVSNAGPGAARDLVVTDYLPNGVTLDSVSGTGWTCDSSGQEITCTLPSLAVSASAEPITIEVTVDISTGWVNNIATVESFNVELDFRNNQQTELTEVAWPEASNAVYLPLIVR